MESFATNVPILIAKAVEACAESGPANQKQYERPKRISFAAGKYLPDTLTPPPLQLLYNPVFQQLLGVPSVLITAYCEAMTMASHQLVPCFRDFRGSII